MSQSDTQEPVREYTDAERLDALAAYPDALISYREPTPSGPVFTFYCSYTGKMGGPTRTAIREALDDLLDWMKTSE